MIASRRNGISLGALCALLQLAGCHTPVATPLTPAQSVLLMGVLSIIYCTMGGIEAVIITRGGSGCSRDSGLCTHERSGGGRPVDG